MMSAGEASGDMLAAEWVRSFRAIAGSVPPVFFGAGGPQMAAAGVELSEDLTRHALIGIPTYGQYRRLRQIRDTLLREAIQRQPDIFIGVDFFGFNGSLAREFRAAVSDMVGPFHNWRPKIVQYVSPQVWASRPGRAQRMAESHDLLLSILPFEKEWYRQNAPKLQVEFVGHPIVDRHLHRPIRSEAMPHEIVLLPGSRKGELMRHLPLVMEAGARLKQELGVVPRLILPPSIDLGPFSTVLSQYQGIEVLRGGLSEALTRATLALACTGTVTLECAWHAVPTIAFYRTSRTTFEIGKRLVTVRYLAMPNLLACGVGAADLPGSSPVVPELIQDDATPDRIVAVASEWLKNSRVREQVGLRLRAITETLGEPGASDRAARAVLKLINAVTEPCVSKPHWGRIHRSRRS